MKLLHTADWHIGKKLYKHELYEDFSLFIQWLYAFIKEQKIDVLLVSGDIFDSSNPTSEARKQFYQSLVLLHSLGCKIILTGGNHDSPSVLNAPQELLKELDIHIIGSLPEDISKCIIPIQKQEKVELIVAAIPFLRDTELRKLSDGVSYEEKIKMIQNGIEAIFAKAYSVSNELYPNTPMVAMGHLFATGNFTASEDEREIQLGNEARFDATRLQEYYKYIALGHIHKPQQVTATIPIYYSGSPIALSFSERKEEKRVLVIDTEKGFIPESFPIPQFRKLIAIKGNFSEIKQKIYALSESSLLKNLIEVTLIEDVFNPKTEDDFNQFVMSYTNDFYEIVKTKMEFKDRVIGASELFDSHTQLSDLKPQEVFEKLLETQEYETDIKQELITLFQDLVDEIYHTQQNQ